MLVFPNAKINIGLNVTEKRQDGFHNLESCFYPVQWNDILEIVEAFETKFTSSGIEIPGRADDNLCLKAYHLLAQDFELPPVHIHLHKVIPIGAGLGGGSADASFTLKLLNEMFALNITHEQLQTYAAQLGSDCPFFIKNEALMAFGRGDEFEALQLDLSGKYIVLINPNIHISTKEAYAGIRPAKAERAVKEVIEQLPIEKWKAHLINDFETSIFPNHPEIKALKEKLYECGALYASMSGSGATVYGIFENETDLRDQFDKEFMIWNGELK